LLRGARHRAHVRATRWLAMTDGKPMVFKISCAGHLKIESAICRRARAHAALVPHGEERASSCASRTMRPVRIPRGARKSALLGMIWDCSRVRAALTRRRRGRSGRVKRHRTRDEGKLQRPFPIGARGHYNLQPVCGLRQGILGTSTATRGFGSGAPRPSVPLLHLRGV
jgi:hypothetical protein